MLNVIGFPVGLLQSNCYLLFDEESRQTAVIDPGDEGDNIIQTIKDNNLQPILIINTHGHGDHIGANQFIKRTFNIPLAIHKDDAIMLKDANENLSGLFGPPILSPGADRLLEDNEEIEFGGQTIKVLHTPGHSPGGCSLLIENHLFSGDALFKMSIGRTDFPKASHERLMRGIIDKILSLPEETIVYPGHGPTTTVGEEKRNNPFILQYQDNRP